MKQKRPIKTTAESRVVQTQRVFPSQLNQQGTIYAGHIMSMIDTTASISASRHTRKNLVTASMDSIDFIKPVGIRHSVCAESFISGVGSSSVEAFCKVTIEELETGDRALCATAFITFACFEEDGSLALVPLIEAITKEERFISSGYEERRKVRLEGRVWSLDMQDKISLIIPPLTNS